MSKTHKLSKLLFLTGPQRPIGAYSFSSGCESFVSFGEITNGESLSIYLKGLISLSYVKTELPLLRRCFISVLNRDIEALSHWNQIALALRETNELHVEEVDLGAAIMRLVNSLKLAKGFFKPEGLSNPGYIAATAIFAGALGLEEDDLRDLLEAFLWSLVENQALSASKSVPLGQRDSQNALCGLIDCLPEYVDEALKIEDQEIGLSLPFRAILSSMHEES
ncbi:MAG: hypothetical protein LBE27_06235, partial [Deltaproteobacteria bacterium]|nr:hypothetical protein [Deltaproteobacteria bacterium]